MRSSDFEEYVTNYDNSSVIENKINLDCNIIWDKCYFSDLKRDIIIAKSIYDKKLGIMNLLIKVKIYPVKKSQLNIFSFLWSISSRISWKLNNVSQLETVTLKRQYS